MSISFDFAWVSLCKSKKYSLLSRISKIVSFWLFLLKRNIWEKGRFFDKNHALTPLQNVDFLAFFGTFLLWSKKHSILSRIWQDVSFCLFLLKKNIWENGQFFSQKSWTKPFAKCWYSLTLLELPLFRSKKQSFLSRI